MVRVAAYVDGFNLYFGLKAKHGRKYLWLDLQALAASLLRPGQTLEQVTYFTARVRNDPDGERRQSDYLDALVYHSPLVTIVSGHFQEKHRRCRQCGSAWTVYEVLFIDAPALGSMVSRTQRILTPVDVRQITATYEGWRDRRKQGRYEDVPGFSASVTIQEIRAHDYRLTPSRYVGTPIAADTTAETVLGLRRKLDRLHARSVEVDAMAGRQLNRIDAWTP